MTINVPFSQTRLLEVDAGPDIFMQSAGEVSLGEALNVVGGTPVYTYAWRDESGNILDGQIIMVALPGIYSIMVSDVKNCTAFDSLEVIDAVYTHSGKTNFPRLYPNPSSGTVFIPADGSGSPVRIRIVAADGKVVHDQVYKPGGQDLQMDLHGLEAGVYLIHLTDRKTFRTYTFIMK